MVLFHVVELECILAVHHMGNPSVVIALWIDKVGLVERFMRLKSRRLTVVIGRKDFGEGVLHLDFTIEGRIETFSGVQTAIPQ